MTEAAKSPVWESQTASGGVLGQEALVTRELAPSGEVHVGGEFWSAELANAEFLPPGTKVARGEHVRVVRIEDVHLFVEPIADDVPSKGDDSATANV